MGYYCTVAVDFCPSIKSKVESLLSSMRKKDQHLWEDYCVVEHETYLFTNIKMYARLPYVQSFYQLFNHLDIAGLTDQYKYIVLWPGSMEEDGFFEDGRLQLVRKIDFKPGA